MTRDDIIRIYEKANGWSPEGWDKTVEELERFAALVAAVEREKVAAWMIKRDYATGPGEATEDLLAELDWQIAENWNRAMINGVETEREACAKFIEDHDPSDHLAATIAAVIRSRGQG